MDRDFNNGYMPPFMDYNMQAQNGFNDINDPMLNPIMQYEQNYSYYKYLAAQMEYKIKCKEFEMICNEYSLKNSNNNSNDRKERRIE